MPYIGEFAALTTALCWVVTAMSFESAGRRVGSLAVNLLRLILAFFFLSGLGLVARGHLWPSDAGAHQWIWLPLSGLVGFTIGDLALFRAFVLIGSRLSTLIMSCVPLIAAVVGWFVMGERLTGMDVAGMALTLSGVALAVLERRKNTGGVFADASVKGVALGLVGAVGQAVGLVLSKYGMRDYDPFAATQIRVIAGIAGFSVLLRSSDGGPKQAKRSETKAP
ncbi:MAG: DMT family transporter [Deltaproteobacteria bacterium]|nr:DMT family transporter [Deltaproteobacteria bacterium]